ncbi:helix-turn-helix domain-containing protein [Spongiimicrobium sp. 3-5]|uniref:helix-turn-helix domain-containing protein n=1 Tax=Spongiimicrobium sp. 3-5 TaxID=3332596 RepID=UPI003980F47C
MSNINGIIAENIKQLRALKGLSQKQVSMEVGIPQGQYSLVENGKVMPTIPTLEKIAGVFEVSVAEFFRANNEEDVVNLSLLEKIKIIDTLDDDEKEALLKLIDIAVSKKKLRDNLNNLIAS